MGLTRKSETGVFAIPDQISIAPSLASFHRDSSTVKPPLKPKQTYPYHDNTDTQRCQ